MGTKKSKLKMRPLHDRIVVRRIEEDDRTAGGIIIPDAAKEKPQEGEILAVGTGHLQEDGTLRPLELEVGDRVLFAKWGGTEIKIGGEDLMIFREDDVLGVIED